MLKYLVYPLAVAVAIALSPAAFAQGSSSG
jgi:hypothetical protein